MLRQFDQTDPYFAYRSISEAHKRRKDERVSSLDPLRRECNRNRAFTGIPFVTSPSAPIADAESHLFGNLLVSRCCPILGVPAHEFDLSLRSSPRQEQWKSCEVESEKAHTNFHHGDLCSRHQSCPRAKKHTYTSRGCSRALENWGSPLPARAERSSRRTQSSQVPTSRRRSYAGQDPPPPLPPAP